METRKMALILFQEVWKLSSKLCQRMRTFHTGEHVEIRELKTNRITYKKKKAHHHQPVHWGADIGKTKKMVPGGIWRALRSKGLEEWNEGRCWQHSGRNALRWLSTCVPRHITHPLLIYPCHAGCHWVPWCHSLTWINGSEVTELQMVWSRRWGRVNGVLPQLPRATLNEDISVDPSVGFWIFQGMGFFSLSHLPDFSTCKPLENEIQSGEEERYLSRLGYNF